MEVVCLQNRCGDRNVFAAVVTLIGVAGQSGWQGRRISLLPGDHAEAGMREGHGGRDTMAGEATGRKSSRGQGGTARAAGGWELWVGAALLPGRVGARAPSKSVTGARKRTRALEEQDLVTGTPFLPPPLSLTPTHGKWRCLEIRNTQRQEAGREQTDRREH